MIARFIIWLIHLYQKSFPLRYVIMRNLHLPYHPCRFSPTCSQYTVNSIHAHGLIKGIIMGVTQIMRCR